jgi:hypothetical protein
MNGIDEYKRDGYRKIGPNEKIDSSGSPGKAEEKKQGGDELQRPTAALLFGPAPGLWPMDESHATIFV